MYQAEHITKGMVSAAGDNARYYHKEACEIRLRGQAGHDVYEAESQASYENLGLMRDSLIREAQVLATRAALFPSDEDAATNADQYLGRIDQIDEYLIGADKLEDSSDL